MTTDTDGSGLGDAAAKGAALTLAGQAVRLVILLASTVVLARILAPEDFGLMAIVLSLVAFGELFRDFGLTTASAREQNLSKGQKSNLFWTNLVLGSVLAATTFLIAAPLARFFSQPLLEVAIQWVALTFVLNGASAQFRAELNRNLRFLALSLVDTLPAAVGLVVAILWSQVFGADFYVLISQQLAVALLGLFMAVTLAGWFPGLPDRNASIAQLFRFSSALFGSQSIAYFTKNLDNLALGFVWGTVPLGLYSRAYQLLMMPLNQIAAPLTRVMVPILTRAQHDHDSYARYVRKSQSIGSVGLCLLYAICIGLADPIVNVVFGAKWGAMVPLFQVLAVGGIFRALVQMSFWIFLSKGQSGAQLRLYLVSQPIIILLILAGLPWGALGVAVGHSAGYCINWFLSMWWCGRATGVRTMPLVQSGLRSIVLLAAPVIVIGLMAARWLQNDLVIIGSGLAGIVLYLALASKVSVHVRTSILDIVQAINKARS